MEDSVTYIITFNSSHQALKAESKLKKAALLPKLISSPRAISSKCGFCIALEKCDRPTMPETLNQLNVEYTHLYTRKLLNGVKHYDKQD
ncbi:DUF3343 domain-containing protein [Photobacterium alginatilyticum]|uniref:DUF3343 domain-containing protein n=1 Tax=Photobacterium alginatilyticum TaxID=1775171 RepID=UPI0040678444